MSANGAAEAHATFPKTARNGSWTIDASGIQWAFEGIGRTGFARDAAADLGEDPDEVDVEPLALVDARWPRPRSRPSPGTPGTGSARSARPGRPGRARTRAGEYARPVQRSTGSPARRQYERARPGPLGGHSAGLYDGPVSRWQRAFESRRRPGRPGRRGDPRRPIGLQTLVLHLTLDPLADVRAYYDAGARLNAGLPLYVQPARPDDAAFYRYPPLLAVAFRPLALLPFETAALIWEAVLLVAFVGTVVRSGSATGGPGWSWAGWPRRSPGASPWARPRSSSRSSSSSGRRGGSRSRPT